LLPILFVSFVVLLLLGAPIAYSMGLASIFALLFGGAGFPLEVVVQRTYNLLDSYSLLAIPFFIVSGELMSSGGISKRLVQFASDAVGHFRGNMAQVSILSSMIFAGVSGSSVADAAACGSILIPAMRSKGYDKGWTAALQASAATMGPIIPPSMNMIIYGSLTGVSIGALFMGGVIPGVLIGVSMMCLVIFLSTRPKFGYLRASGKFVGFKKLWTSFRHAILALFMPVIIIGGIISGIFTATEAGIAATVYALFVGMFVYKEIRLKDLGRIFVNAALTSSTVLLIAGLAGPFGWLMGIVQFPQKTVAMLTTLSDNPIIILLLIILFLLVLTCFVEVLAAMILVAPVLVQVCSTYSFHPIYFGVIVVIALLIGQVTPPVGVLLYVTSGIAECKFSEICRHIWPFIILLATVVLLCVFFPPLVTFLPSLLMN
jgi:tripartite ATP-independent transporter DctM subunit